MANVLNKLTKQYLQSVNTPDYPESDWIINPILPNCDQKFWLIEGDSIREMTQSEKDAYAYANESVILLIAEKQLRTGQDGADYETDTNAIINPDMLNCDLKYVKVASGKVVEMSLPEQDAVDLSDAIFARQNKIKQQCTAHILAAYPEAIQRSAAIGMYSDASTGAMATFLAACIEEENRCYDAIEVAKTVEEANAITPAFPEA